MKIALFTIKNLFACHYALFGYRETLERMGHTVLDFPFPQNSIDLQMLMAKKAVAPTIEELMECDVVFSTYHEYVQPWLRNIYPLDQWEALMRKVPVLARFDESMDRGDLQLPHRVPELLKWANHYSFPAVQDAKRYGGEWLAYGADTTVFKPCVTAKLYKLAFVGTLYQQRADYLNKLVNHIGATTEFRHGNVFVQDLSGLRERESTELLAENYRQIQIFFCLPPNSRLLVEKIFDIMACNTMVMYPQFPGAAGENMSIFENRKHIVYYDYGYFADNGAQVKHYLTHPNEVQAIAEAGGELVRTQYTLEQMLEKMLLQCRLH